MNTQTNDEVPKITRLCNAINQMVLDLNDKNEETAKKILTLEEDVSANKKAIEALQHHLKGLRK